LYFVAAMMGPALLRAQPASPSTPAANPPPIVLTVEGTNVTIQRFRSIVWESAHPNQVLGAKDRGRTGLRSRTSVRLSDLSVLRIDQLSEFEIQPLPDPTVEAEFSLMRGLLYLLNRDRPGKHRFVTPTATAATRGTEFTLEVDPVTGRSVLTVLEGEAELSNAAGSIRLASGEQGVALLGQKPTKTAVVDTTNVVQWCLYYPGVLDLDELALTPEEQTAVGDSLAAYRSGDLLRAVAAFPADRTPASDQEKIYLAALLLSVGQVSQTEALLASLTGGGPSPSRSQSLADALRTVIAAVNRRAPAPRPKAQGSAQSATEQLARSYAEQARSDLESARESARAAVEKSPRFAFAWARLAELEFSRGNTRGARAGLERSLALAPRNAQALALKGFVLSAENRLREAIDFFEQAMAVDGGLGNAWLGRGLCRIRQGRAEEGRLDLQIAATTEPQRSLLRSYLGKAFSNAGDSAHAEKELRLASEIDAGDPTPWLYSALLLQQQNRLNEGVRDLEHSQELNDNRRVYRSRLLLDQDRAVRGANLANLYRDAGLIDVSVREAGRAVNADYANYSAHLFLANSFNELRDPRQVDLRYETAWFTEYLLANLLAPVGAGTLSQTVSAQEYSKLFERDRLGAVSFSEYASHGEWLQRAVQFGTSGDSSYAAELSYHSENGWRPNEDLSEWTALVELKHQLTPQDSLYFQATWDNADYGDLAPRYFPSDVNHDLRIRERREPFLLGGYHHEWSPGNHTLLLAGRLQDTYLVANPAEFTPFYYHFAATPPTLVVPLFYNQHYRLDQDIDSVELQQIWQRGDHALVLGGRFQHATFRTRNDEGDGVLYDATPVAFRVAQGISTEVERRVLYAYDQWQFWPSLTLLGGVSYDWLRFPENYRYGPISRRQDERDQISPKVGFIFTPARGTTLRGAYFRGLGGVNLEQSVRLEPSQVAGFNQAFRSLIPESVGGLNAAPTFDGWALSLEQKFGRGTFVAVSGEILSSEVGREVGAVDFQIPVGPGPSSPFSTTQAREQLDFRERTLTVTFNQLLGEEWSLGARYRLSRVDYQDRYPDLPASAGFGGFQRDQNLEAILSQVQLTAFYNHPAGFFAGVEALWTSQSNQGYHPDRPGDDFWQFNVEGGWRFWQRRAELRLALLNLADRDYRLNPLNLTATLPRGREVVMSLRLNF